MGVFTELLSHDGACFSVAFLGSNWLRVKWQLFRARNLNRLAESPHCVFLSNFNIFAWGRCGNDVGKSQLSCAVAPLQHAQKDAQRLAACPRIECCANIQIECAGTSRQMLHTDGAARWLCAPRSRRSERRPWSDATTAWWATVTFTTATLRPCWAHAGTASATIRLDGLILWSNTQPPR